MFVTEPMDEVVGFTAYYSLGTAYYGFDDIVVFDSFVSNIGGYYKTSSSQFICPVDGMYAFSFHIMTGNSNLFIGQLMKETEILVGVYADSYSGAMNGVSNMVVTVCSKGERVWVVCDMNTSALYGDDTRYTTFSGYLLNRL